MTMPVTDPAAPLAPAAPPAPPAPAFDPRTGDPTAAPPANDPAGVWANGVVPATVPAPTITPPTAAPPAAPTQTGDYIEVAGQRYYTQSFLERARGEERDKMHGRLETIEQEMTRQRQEREAELQAERERAATEAAEQERQRLQALPTEERLIEMQNTWERRWAERDEADQRRAALEEQERAFQRVQSYKARRVLEEGDLILPALQELVTGYTEQEVEESISALKAKTDAIVGGLRQEQVDQRQQMRGVAPTGAPPVGPMDTTSGSQSVSPADIAAMDPATFAKNRDQLFGAMRQSIAERGIYG